MENGKVTHKLVDFIFISQPRRQAFRSLQQYSPFVHVQNKQQCISNLEQKMRTLLLMRQSVEIATQLLFLSLP